MKTTAPRHLRINAPLLIAIASATATSALILSKGPGQALTEAAIGSMLLAVLVLAIIAAVAPFIGVERR